MCNKFSQINAVGNVEGKGRDDLGYEILLECERVLRRVTREQSKAVRKIGEKIKLSFEKLRELMRKYDQNIEMVDPQLRNNADLVELLLDYEQSWEKGLNYFLVNQKCNQLIYFSHIIETTQEKYAQFKQQIDERDAHIFLVIPCLLILKYLEHDDKNICLHFLPQLQDTTTKQYY